MHKTSLMSALALVVTLAASAGAQGVNSTDHPARPQGTEQNGGFRRGRGGPDGMLLKGITLSADQKQKLADLRTRDRQEWEKSHPRGPNGQNGADARPRREPGDTTGFGARRAEMEKRFDARIAEVRNILTSDQRTQFDKNVADMKAHRAEHGGRFGGRGAKNS
ncbi:MAG TPA: Spy/CpxP family protein refolding chaperone [Gemmatimonadaceae bacterium]